MLLSTLTQWSHEHIARIFTSTNDEDSLRALEETFSQDVVARLNGRQIKFDDIKRSVLALRREAVGYGGLRVHWEHSVEASEESNRHGSFGGAYVIRGIHRKLPGEAEPIEFERRKTVIVQIESQDDSTERDSRIIVDIVFVAMDVRVA
ncbi:hypothetical protein CPC08DRAFT_728730 [Agrocybe pediades]|nr:hypothetical protein CPC08DRAFT_728730 [Agrocybe pediades]